MRQLHRRGIALFLLVALPSAAVAAPRGGGGGSRPAAPAARAPAPAFRAPAAPVSRPAPPSQPAAPSRPASGGGFNFNHDITPPAQPERPAPAARPVQPEHPVQAPQRPVQAPEHPGATGMERGQARPVPHPQPPGNVANHAQRTFPHAPFSVGAGGPYRGRFHGPRLPNPHHWSGNWGWNHGIAWQPAPIYWGGGFWGPWAIAALTDAILFGSIVDYENQVIYPSYEVEPDSPGAQLLQNYGLTQTECGPPNLVVIWGPDNSVICAYPNDLVGPGNYELDPDTLTIVSQ